MAVNWEGSQARADAEPRMRELVTVAVLCSWCLCMVLDFEENAETGQIVCEKCLEDMEEEEDE